MKIAIVGTGIVGRLMAWHLCVQHEVHLFTQETKQSELACSYIAGGMISPYAERYAMQESYFKSAEEALMWWPIILKSLPKQVFYQDNGTLVVALKRHSALLNHFIEKINYQQSSVELAILKERQLQALEPLLTDVVGVHLPEAQLCPQQLFLAMNGYFEQHGVVWHERHQVDALKAHTVISDKGNVEFDKIFDCRGMGAKASLPELRGVRGEIIHCVANHVTLSHSVRFLHPQLACYIVPWQNNHFAIGATEIENENRAGISIRSTLELLSGAANLIPAFLEAAIISVHAHLRPTTTDNVPCTNECAGVISLNGFYRHGFLLAPALTAKVASALVGDAC